VSDFEYLLTESKPCLCQVVPALVINPGACEPGSCAQSNFLVRYRSCPRNDIGVFNSAVLVLRWQMPALFQLLFSHDWSPLGALGARIPAIKTYNEDIRDGVKMTDLQVTCAKMGLFDVILVLLGFHILMYMVVPVTKAAVDTVISAASATMIGSVQLAAIDDLINSDDDSTKQVVRTTEEAAAGGKGRGRSGRRERILSPVPGKYG